jgi:hypothetical protein
VSIGGKPTSVIVSSRPARARARLCAASFYFSSDDDLGVAITKLDLPSPPARDVNLAQDDGYASLSAARRPAGAHVPAAPDLDGCRLRIEVGLKHRAEAFAR